MSKDKRSRELLQPVKSNHTEAILDALRQSDSPQTIVNSLQPHDLLSVFNGADDEQKSDLLTLAEKEQLDLLVDLIGWDRDRPDLARIESIFTPLALTGLGGSSRILDTLEPELSTLLLRRNVVVHLLENRNDELQTAETSEVVPFPDGFYFLEFPQPDAITDTQRALFQALVARPFEHYQRELECLRHDLSSDLEERAFRWKTARLADFGFSPRDEAIYLLTPRSAEEVRGRAAQKSFETATKDSALPLPILYRENLQGVDFLSAVFDRLGTGAQAGNPVDSNRINSDLTATLSAYLTAIDADIGNTQTVARGIQEARNLLSIGLQETAKNEVENGVHLLSALAPSFFFQVGIGLLYPLQKRSRALLADPSLTTTNTDARIFDPIYAITLTALAKDVPKAFLPALSSDTILFDLVDPLDGEISIPRNLEELTQTTDILEEAEALLPFLKDILGPFPFPEQTPGSVLLLTALANAAFDRDLKPIPLIADDAARFDRLVREAGPDRFAEQAMIRLVSHIPLVTQSPMERLLRRLIRTGTARLLGDVPHRSVLLG